MIQKPTPEDSKDNDKATHEEIRAVTQETIDTTDDKVICDGSQERGGQHGREKRARGRWHTKRSIKEAGGNSTPILNSNLQQMSKDRNLPKEVGKSSNNTDNKTRARRQ